MTRTEVQVHQAHLVDSDAAARHLGFEFVDGGPGEAVVRLAVGKAHINFHGTCHGGVLFALADTAFGLAANSDGVTATGIDTHMTFNAAVRPGRALIILVALAGRIWARVRRGKRRGVGHHKLFATRPWPKAAPSRRDMAKSARCRVVPP